MVISCGLMWAYRKINFLQLGCSTLFLGLKYWILFYSPFEFTINFLHGQKAEGKELWNIMAHYLICKKSRNIVKWSYVL